jgi:DNA adenine methylase
VTRVRRPVLRYHGGKWVIAPWIVANLPPHRKYVELYGGAGSVLLRKPRSYAEIYNDIDGMLVNVFRVLRDPDKAERLRRELELTPFAREEFDAAFNDPDPTDDVERARRTIVLSYMGFGTDSITRGYRTGFRGKSNRSGTTPAHDWRNYPLHVASWIERLRGVVIEHRDAFEVMDYADDTDTLFYVDPPYVHSSRTSSRGKHGYRFEMSDDDHVTLAARLHSVRGQVVISGYWTELYADLYSGWTVRRHKAMADGAHEREEILWISPGSSAQSRFALAEAHG